MRNEDVKGVPGTGGQPPTAAAQTVQGCPRGLTTAQAGETCSLNSPPWLLSRIQTRPAHLGKVPRLWRGSSQWELAAEWLLIFCSFSLKLFPIWKWFLNPAQERVGGAGNIFLLKTKKEDQPSKAESRQPRLRRPG